MKWTPAISSRQMAKELKMQSSAAILAIHVLIEKGILERNAKGEFALNKKAISDQYIGHENSPKVTRISVTSDQNIGHSDQNIGHSECNILKDSLKIGEIGEAPPSFSEILGYCKKTGKTIDAQKFHDFYSARGWSKGRNPINDWKAVVDEWQATEYKDKAEQSKAQPGASGAYWRPSKGEVAGAVEARFHAQAIKNDKCVYCHGPAKAVIGCDCGKYSSELEKCKGEAVAAQIKGDK